MRKLGFMKSGTSPLYKEGLEELMRKNYRAERFGYTTDHYSAYKDSDAIFIGVGTPEQPDESANLSYIATVASTIAESIIKIAFSKTQISLITRCL